ncbi:hypothetical protein F5X96DRAFT_667506 [Biscogniauxia mediterranea]|nr:hypothetical protein F5X96DRAFT_667506 [Biscogniauxia mediterranea]
MATTAMPVLAKRCSCVIGSYAKDAVEQRLIAETDNHAVAISCTHLDAHVASPLVPAFRFECNRESRRNPDLKLRWPVRRRSLYATTCQEGLRFSHRIEDTSPENTPASVAYAISYVSVPDCRVQAETQGLKRHGQSMAYLLPSSYRYILLEPTGHLLGVIRLFGFPIPLSVPSSLARGRQGGILRLGDAAVFGNLSDPVLAALAREAGRGPDALDTGFPRRSLIRALTR